MRSNRTRNERVDSRIVRQHDDDRVGRRCEIDPQDFHQRAEARRSTVRRTASRRLCGMA